MVNPVPALALVGPIVIAASIWVMAAWSERAALYIGCNFQGAPWLHNGGLPSLGEVSIARFEPMTSTSLTSLAT